MRVFSKPEFGSFFITGSSRIGIHDKEKMDSIIVI